MYRSLVGLFITSVAFFTHVPSGIARCASEVDALSGPRVSVRSRTISYSPAYNINDSIQLYRIFEFYGAKEAEFLDVYIKKPFADVLSTGTVDSQIPIANDQGKFIGRDMYFRPVRGLPVGIEIKQRIVETSIENGVKIYRLKAYFRTAYLVPGTVSEIMDMAEGTFDVKVEIHSWGVRVRETWPKKPGGVRVKNIPPVPLMGQIGRGFVSLSLLLTHALGLDIGAKNIANLLNARD
ncbi:MAG: hypothetical protein IT289_13405 [Oligoflexia bacterium]|nr:hypothetical protein [Oligoflexia bacterium]